MSTPRPPPSGRRRCGGDGAGDRGDGGEGGRGDGGRWPRQRRRCHRPRQHHYPTADTDADAGANGIDTAANNGSDDAGLAWLGLAFGLVLPGLAWLGWAWPALAWPGWPQHLQKRHEAPKTPKPSKM
jgi:hypothetical protein